jgi:hypothetical protein
MFGTLQVAYKHAGVMLSRPSGISLITIPNIFLFQFGFTLLAPIMDLLLIWVILTEVSQVFLSAGVPQDDTLPMLLRYWLFFQTVDLLAAAIAVALDGSRSGWRLLPLVFLQRFSYRQLLYWVAVRALLAAIKGQFVGWGKLVRTGSVSLPLPSVAPR